MAYLVDVDRNRLDSMPLTEDGRFTFSVSDSVASAYPLLLQLENPGKPSDELNMPFMVEAGEVRMELGEYVRVWGTPLNSRVQQFLDGFFGGRVLHRRMFFGKLSVYLQVEKGIRYLLFLGRKCPGIQTGQSDP